MFDDATANRRERLATASVTVSGEPIVGLRLAVVDPIRIPVNPIFEDASAPRPERVFVFARHRRTAWAAAAPRFATTAGCRWRSSRGRTACSASAATPWQVKRVRVPRPGGGSGGGRPDGGAGRPHRRRVHDPARRRSTAASPTAAASRSRIHGGHLPGGRRAGPTRADYRAHADGPARPAGPLPRRAPAAQATTSPRRSSTSTCRTAFDARRPRRPAPVRQAVPPP